MHMANLNQAPHNTTLMGVMRGVVDYHGLDISDATLYGSSGHAFVINIHAELCPSGPYCWDGTEFKRLVKNLGIKVVDHGFFSSDTPVGERKELEATLIGRLDAGTPCSLLNMENQLITGYDETGLITAQPWAPKVDFPPAHLTFGTWDEFGEECHVNFYSFERVPGADPEETVLASLEYAAALWANPTAYTDEPYGIGPEAYSRFIEAVGKGHGDTHGCWWNATVWSECRSMAANYCEEIASAFPHTAQVATSAARRYAKISEGLSKASDKNMAATEKLAILDEVRAEEERCIGDVKELAVVLGSKRVSDEALA